MKPEQEFDKIINQRIEESESDFAFDESNWQKTSKLIDAERGAAGHHKNKRFLLLGALFFIFGTVVFFGYKYINISGEKQLAFENARSAGMNGKPASNNSPGTAKNKVVTENSTENSASNEIKNGEGVSVIQKQLNGKTESNYSSSRFPENDLGSSITGQSNAKSGKSGGNNFNSNSNGIANNIGRQTKEMNAKDVPANSNGVKSSENTEGSDARENAGSNMYENLFLKTKITGIPDHNIDGDIRKTSYDFIRIYNDDYFKSKRRKTFYLDAEVGAAYMFGWNAPKGKDAKGFNAYAGLNVGFHIKKKFSANVGAQVYNLSNIQQPFYTGSNLSYDFGSNGTYTTITTNSLFYFAVPLKINYAIDKRNSIGAGVNTAFLFNGQNTIETFNMADGAKTNVQTINNTGYYEGTNTTNIMLSAFYTRAITRRVKLNGEVMYGISDIYKNTSNNSTRQNNMGVRLGLQYTLFDK